MRLRDFSTQMQGRPTLICAPYALHGATIADFAPGHSIIEVLHRNGLPRVYVTEWRSATPEMRYFSIDSHMADLNVAVDELGPPVDLIGLCQGAWMALVYAARFPNKVGRLVLVGAPVDVSAGISQLSRLAADVPLETFEELVRLGEGRVLGQCVLEHWGPALAADDVSHVLQVSSNIDAECLRELEKRFREWYAWTVDLPGTYYLQVTRCLFKENQIAQGRFVALGRQINLAGMRLPVFMLAARDDELVHPDQLFATGRLIGTAKADVKMVTEPCGHLGLFLGARSLGGSWQKIARWLRRDSLPATSIASSGQRSVLRAGGVQLPG
jgi:poly(3-hydroxyalkanoate) synthetase